MSFKLSLMLLLFLIFLVIGLIWFVIINFGSIKINHTLTKIIGFILAAIVFIFIDIYSINNKYSSSVKILIPRNENCVTVDQFYRKLMSVGSAHYTGYQIMDKILTFRENKTEDSSVKKDKYVLDLLENTFWMWFSKEYHLHWQVASNEFIGIDGGKRWAKSIAENAFKKTFVIEPEEMQVILIDNYFRVSKADFWGIHLPTNSHLKALERTKSRRIFEIENNNLLVQISIIYTGNSGIEHSKLGNKILEDYPDQELYANNLLVEFDCNLKRSRIYSIETEKQLEWFKEIQDNFYNDFDWTLIKPDLEKAYLK